MSASPCVVCTLFSSLDMLNYHFSPYATEILLPTSLIVYLTRVTRKGLPSPTSPHFFINFAFIFYTTLRVSLPSVTAFSHRHHLYGLLFLLSGDLSFKSFIRLDLSVVTNFCFFPTTVVTGNFCRDTGPSGYLSVLSNLITFRSAFFLFQQASSVLLSVSFILVVECMEFLF